MATSKKYSLNGADVVAIVKGAGVAAGGALLTYLATEVVPNLDQSTMLGATVAGIASIVLNVVRKYLAGER